MAKNLHFVFPLVLVAVLAYRLFAPTSWPKFDLVEIGLVCLMFSPYLARIFSELSVGGLFTAKLRDLQQQVADVTTEQAVFEDKVLFNNSVKVVESATDIDSVSEKAADFPTNHKLEKLSGLYIKTRREMSPGASRTARMEAIMQTMIQEAGKIGHDWSNLKIWISSNDPGRQLSAIAYGLCFPKSVEIGDLMRVIKETEQPFVQYWALRLVRFLVRDHSDKLLSELNWRFLAELQQTLPKSTDRARLIESIFTLSDRP